VAKKIAYEISSGNIFEDLGVSDPDENLARAAIARQIERLLNELALTQAEIGKQLKLPQSAVSRLMNGRYRDFSTDRLMRILLRLGRDIEITIRPASKRRTEGHLTVKAA
jgi:predicted XRE-type DNA-binding protein